MTTTLFGPISSITSSLATRLALLLEQREAQSGVDAMLAHPIEILVPGRGAASSIIASLLDKRRRPAAGLIIRSLEDYSRHLLSRSTSALRAASPLERSTAMWLASRSVEHSLFHGRNTHRLLERTLRDIRDSGVSLEELLRRSIRLRDRSRIVTLGSAWKRYLNLLGSIGAVDPAELLEAAAASIVPGIPAQIVFGFYDTTGVQQRLLDAVAQAGAIDSFYIPVPRVDGQLAPGYGFASAFAAGAVSLSQSVEDLPSATRAGCSIRGHRDTASEFRDVCRSVAGLLAGGVAPATIGVVVRSIDPQEVLLLERTAERHGFALRTGRGRPLASHRLGRALLRMLELSERRFPRAEVVGLVRDGMRLTRRPAPELDFATRKAGIAGGTAARAGRLVAASVAANPKLQETLDDYLEALGRVEPLARGMSATLTGKQWNEAIDNFLDAFHLETEDDLAAASALGEIGETLGRCANYRAPIDPQIVSDAIRAGEIRLPSPENAVWFGDVMTLRGRTFEHLFAICVQGDRFPQRRTDDALLPDRDRNTLGVRKIGDGAEEEELLFQLVLDAGSNVAFSFSGENAAGRSLRPSQLLQRLAYRRETDSLKRRKIFEDFRQYAAEASSTPEGEVLASPSDLPLVTPIPPRPGSIALPSTSLRDPSHAYPPPASYDTDACVGEDGVTEYELARSLACPPTHPLGMTSKSDPVAPAEDSISPSPHDAPLRRALRRSTLAGRMSEYDGIVATDPEVLLLLKSRLEKIPATHLDDFGECPQKFFFKRIARVDETNDPEHELQIDRMNKGSLDHGILERFYREGIPSALLQGPELSATRLPEPALSRLRAVIGEEFDRFDAEHPPLNAVIRRIEREVTLAILEPFVAGDIQEMRQQGLRPIHFEYSFGTDRMGPPDHSDPIPLTAGDSPVIVHGVIDRIDRDSSGAKLRIVDYKSGRAARFVDLAAHIDSGRRMQLGLYALAIESIFGVAAENITGTILPLRPDAASAKFQFSLGEARATLLENVELFARTIGRGEFAAFPDDKTCGYCPLASSCRTRHSAAERAVLGRYAHVKALLTQRERAKQEES